MMISVKQPKFPQEIEDGIEIATIKECSSQITQVKDFIFISVYANDRPVGRFVFQREEDKCTLERKTVIERDFHSFEYALDCVVKYLKNKKVAYLLWN